jgi:hypothetical protein
MYAEIVVLALIIEVPFALKLERFLRAVGRHPGRPHRMPHGVRRSKSLTPSATVALR